MGNITMEEIEQYMEYNQNYFESSEIPIFKNLIYESDLTIYDLNALKLRSPVTGLLLSLFLGYFGVDRIYSGNFILAGLKFLTGGGFCIWWAVDWFMIKNAVRKYNQDKLYALLTGAS